MLKKFATFEATDEEDQLFQDLDSIGLEQYKGWIIAESEYYDKELAARYIAVVGKNVQEAITEIYRNLGFIADEEDLDIVSDLKTWESYRESRDNLMSDYNSTFVIDSIYEGLTPIERKPSCLTIDWINPVTAVADLKSVFKNVDQVLGNKMSGTK
jgi:hypothetical protein